MGCYCLLQGIFPTQRIEPASPVSPSPALQEHSLPLSHWGGLPLSLWLSPLTAPTPWMSLTPWGLHHPLPAAFLWKRQPLELCQGKNSSVWCLPSSRASPVAQMVKNLPALQETWVRSLGWEEPLEKEMVTHSSILAWKIPWTE